MAKHKFVMISGDGNKVARWEETFPGSKTVNFGEIQVLDADILWLKLNPLEPALPQIAWLKKHHTQSFVVMSSIPNIREALDAINAGARGYINTHAGPNNLKQVVRVIEDHGIWIGEDLMQLLVGQLAGEANAQKTNTQAKAKVSKGHKVPSSKDWQSLLSKREVEVVQAVVKGLPNKLIARELDITERTVKAHLTAIFEKLAVQDRLKLVLLVAK